MLNIFQFSKDNPAGMADLTGVPFYQMGFGQQSQLPGGKQIHEYVASAHNIRPKDNSFMMVGGGGLGRN